MTGGPVVLRAVLVDDTPDVRLLVRAALEGSGRFRVVGEAGDGAAGIAVAGEEQPDVVLLDLAMPVMDGLEALPAIRRAAPRATVVVLSGFESATMLRQVVSAGAHGYLQKGAAPHELVSALVRLTGGAPHPAPPPAPPLPPLTPPGPAPAIPDGDGVTWLRTAMAGAAHEIRNPTIVIAGAVAALTRTDPPVPELLRDELLAAIARQARLLDRATVDLLTAAQAHHGGVRVDPVPVDLAPALRASAADAPGAPVTVDCPPGLRVCADPVRLQQMLLNLLGNAAKYGAPPVTVAATADGARVRVSVHDSGPGVPEAFRPSLFEEFSRASGTGTHGTGLGLFVVRSLAVAQGGTAWFEAGDVDGAGGATFGFTLPAVGDA